MSTNNVEMLSWAHQFTDEWKQIYEQKQCYTDNQRWRENPDDRERSEFLERTLSCTLCVWQVKTPAGGTGRALGAWAGASVSQAGSPSLDFPSPPPAPLRVESGRSNVRASDEAEQWRPQGKREKKLNANAVAAVYSARWTNLKNTWWVQTMSSLWRRVITVYISQCQTSGYASLQNASCSISNVDTSIYKIPQKAPQKKEDLISLEIKCGCRWFKKYRQKKEHKN